MHLMQYKHCNLIKEEGGVQVLEKLFHPTYDLIIVSKTAISQVEFEFMNLVSRKNGVAFLNPSWLLQQM